MYQPYIYHPEIAFRHRETCPHWINYEILDALPEPLKQKYINQFSPAQFVMALENGKYVPKLRCLASHHDCMHKNIVDCSEHYPKTMEEMNKDFKETLSYREGVYVNEMDPKSN